MCFSFMVPADYWHSPGGESDKDPPANAGDVRDAREYSFDPWVGKIPWQRAWQPTPVFLPGESCGQRSLAGYSPWDCKSQTLLSD